MHKSGVQQRTLLSHNCQPKFLKYLPSFVQWLMGMITSQLKDSSLCINSMQNMPCKNSYLKYFGQSYHWRNSSSKFNFCCPLLLHTIGLLDRSINCDYRSDKKRFEIYQQFHNLFLHHFFPHITQVWFIQTVSVLFRWCWRLTVHIQRPVSQEAVLRLGVRPLTSFYLLSRWMTHFMHLIVKHQDLWQVMGRGGAQETH